MSSITIEKGNNYTVQIIEKFTRIGYNKFRTVDDNMEQLRLQKDRTIKALRTIYPYGLNSKAKKTKKPQPQNDRRIIPSPHTISIPKHIYPGFSLLDLGVKKIDPGLNMIEPLD